MTTAQELIKSAYRERNLIGSGENPSTDEQTEGLNRLNAFLKALFGFEIGEKLLDWPTPPAETSPVNSRYPKAPYPTKLADSTWPYPPANARILAKITSATTIYFPSTPDAGARMELVNVGSGAFTLTLDGNGRLIEGAASLPVDMSAFSGPYKWFFREDLGEWRRLNTLAIGDQSPLPEEFDDLLIIGTAKRLTGRHGVELNQDSREIFADQLRKARARYRQKVETPGGYDLRMKTKHSREEGLYK